MSSHSLALAYNTNGFSHHRLEDALEILGDLGFDGVALTLDVHHLDPYLTGGEEAQFLKNRLQALGLRVVAETGGRYILDARRKHYPSLVSSRGKERRLDLLFRCISLGARLGAEVVSLWSGTPDAGEDEDRAREWLRDGVQRVCRAAEETGIRIAFEPEPGMLVESLRDFDLLLDAVASPVLGLTLDVGHVHCTENEPIPEVIRRYGDRIWNVHIEDGVADRHEHLPFGDGEIDFPPVLEALQEIRYEGLVSVELSRHGHDAPVQAARSIEFLRTILDGSRG
jgi:sugar phosphate isomerase/epimerase